MSDVPRFLIESGGLWGLIVLGLLVHLRRLENERERLTLKIEAEHQARLDDAKQNTKALLETSTRTHEALEVIADQIGQRHHLSKSLGRTSRPT